MVNTRQEAGSRGDGSPEGAETAADDPAVMGSPHASAQEETASDAPVFDPTRLIALLTQVAEVYAERAAQPEVVEHASGKEAVAIVKTTVDAIKTLEAPSPRAIPAAGNGGSGGNGGMGRGLATASKLRAPSSPYRAPWTTGVPARHSSADEGRRAENRASASPGDGISLLQEAVAEVCQYDPETAHLEPWARLIIRMDRLTKKLEAALLKPETPNPKPEAPQTDGRRASPPVISSAQESERDTQHGGPSARARRPCSSLKVRNPLPASSSPSSGSSAQQTENPKPETPQTDGRRASPPVISSL